MKLQTIIWLIMALLMLVLAVSLWMYTKDSNTISVIEESPLEKSVASVEAVNVSERIDNLDDLNADVAPIEFKTIVRDMRNYPKEFKDKSYMKKRKGKWTVQVMNVSEHEIITDYLNNRPDRDKFAYFRFTDQNNQLRYVLSYGLVASLDEAMVLASDIDFGLPESVQVVPEEINRYASMIDNYERGGAVLDMSRNRPRSVLLQKTRYLIPVRRVVKKPPARPVAPTPKPFQQALSQAVEDEIVSMSMGVPKLNANNSNHSIKPPVANQQVVANKPVVNQPTNVARENSQTHSDVPKQTSVQKQGNHQKQANVPKKSANPQNAPKNVPNQIGQIKPFIPNAQPNGQ